MTKPSCCFTTFLCRDCLRYAFMEFIQDELTRIAEEWNTHHIRQSAQNPGGVPDVLYFLPHQNGNLIYLFLHLLLYVINALKVHCLTNIQCVAMAEDYSILKPGLVITEFDNLANYVMADANIQKPTNAEEGLAIYRLLKTALED